MYIIIPLSLCFDGTSDECKLLGFLFSLAAYTATATAGRCKGIPLIHRLLNRCNLLLIFKFGHSILKNSGEKELVINKPTTAGHMYALHVYPGRGGRSKGVLSTLYVSTMLEITFLSKLSHTLNTSKCHQCLCLCTRLTWTRPCLQVKWIHFVTFMSVGLINCLWICSYAPALLTLSRILDTPFSPELSKLMLKFDTFNYRELIYEAS